MRILLRSDPPEKPEWVESVPHSASEIFFVGTSQSFDTAANARDNARENARNQVLAYYGQVIENRAITRSVVLGSARNTLIPYINREDEIQVFAQNVVSEVATTAYYTEVYLNSTNKEEYTVYTLHQINRQKVEDEVAGFASNISERYTSSLSQWNTLRMALEGYTFIAKALEQNPLHRMLAYYESPTGRAGLYEFVRLQIIELANSIKLELMPRRTITESQTLDTPIRLHSSVMPLTGLLDCLVSVYGINSDAPAYGFKTSSEDPFVLQIRNLKPGLYIARIAILLSELTGGIVKNIEGDFSIEVIR